jgi:hypothetical protein
MALTKISRGLLNTGISDSSDATAITIDSSERVGIGITNPQQKLVISDGGGYGFEFAPNLSSVNHILSFDRSADAYRDFKISANQIILGYGQAASNEAMRIDSSGNVGIGAAPTLGALHVTSATTDIVTFENTDAGTTGAQLILYHNSSSPADGDRVGALNFKGQDDAGNDTTYAGIRCLATDVSNTTEDGTLTFSTSRAGSFTEAARINEDGKFIIGATSSQTSDVLQIESPASGGGYGIQIRRNDSNTDQQLGQIKFGNTVDSDIGQIHVKTDGANNSGAMIFSTASSGTTSERMRIDAFGNVGIGASPNANFRNDGVATEKFFQVGSAAVLFADSGITTALANNCAINNSDARIALSGTNPGSMYEQYQGIHVFYTTDSVAAGNAQTMTARFRISQNGDLAGTDTSISSISDERIKKNIADYSDGLNLIKNLKPRTFEFKDTTGIRKTGTQRGFIAQEVLEHDTYWISEEDATDIKDGEYEYTKDTEKRYLSKLNDKDAMYVSAIQEQQEQIEALQSEINTLKGGD